MMTFTEARRRIIAALQDGNFQHEIRAVTEGKNKNLLATNDVTRLEVIALLNRCRGNQHECESHHASDYPPVHIFKPTSQGEQWYVKAYIIIDVHVSNGGTGEPDVAVFISVHKSEHRRSGERG